MSNKLITSDFIKPIEVSSAQFFVNPIFMRKFGSNAPDRGYHLVSFYKHNDCYLPVGYLHYSPYLNVFLVGGGMTDGNVIKLMSEEQKEALKNEKGVLYFMLKYGFKHFAGKCEAFFGHIDIPRSMEVSLAAGFQKTQYPYLVANFHKPMSNGKINKLIDAIHEVGSF